MEEDTFKFTSEELKAMKSNKTIPSKARKESLLLRTHAFGHFGADAMYEYIWHEGFFWTGMRDECGIIVKRCIPCLRYSIVRHGL